MEINCIWDNCMKLPISFLCFLETGAQIRPAQLKFVWTQKKIRTQLDKVLEDFKLHKSNTSRIFLELEFKLDITNFKFFTLLCLFIIVFIEIEYKYDIFN